MKKHFSLLVITKGKSKNLRKTIAQYDRNQRVSPYVVYTKTEAIHAGKSLVEQYTAFLQDMQKKYGDDKETRASIEKRLNEYKNLKTDEDFYNVIAGGFTKQMRRPDGALVSTMNPSAKLASYSEGGTFSGLLKTKTGESADKGYAGEFSRQNFPVFSAVITSDGKWHGRENVSSTGESYESDEELADWSEHFYGRFVEPAVRHNHYLTVVDCYV